VTKTGKPLAQTFVTQRDKFCLARDDAIQGLSLPPNFNYLLGCMTHTASPGDCCSMAPDINTLTYLPCRVLEYSIRYSTEYSSSKKLDSHTPIIESSCTDHFLCVTTGYTTQACSEAMRWVKIAQEEDQTRRGSESVPLSVCVGGQGCEWRRPVTCWLKT